MAREWSELLLLRAGASAAVASEVEADEDPQARRGFVRRLRESLRATRESLGSGFSQTLADGDWEALEEALILADVGAVTSVAVVEELQRAARAERLGGDQLRERLATLLAVSARGGEDAPDAVIDLRALPTVVLMVGVNGTGKTTTLGKLAWQLHRHFGLRVLLGAADTYRAAATEQLEEWARRAGCEIVTGASGSDPGAVAFEALASARAGGHDVVLIDTAGRLHNQEPLMGELEKVRRVIARQLDGAPHETLLTIDATTGQNGVRQAELFARAVAVDGIVLTKLDGSAKGGVAIAIARELGIPVKLIGVGEQLEDLRPFDADEFASALLEDQ
ncbi:MAG: signal recognition particle-docking protein FtsY [Solirubrobacteraceae bacterium]|jgi:fused signal recognition particle receptor